MLGVQVKKVSFNPIMASVLLDTTRHITRKQHFVIAIYGPASAILFLPLVIVDYPATNLILRVAVVINLFNLLPIIPMDGGKLAYWLLDGRINRQLLGVLAIASFVMLPILLVLVGVPWWIIGLLLVLGPLLATNEDDKDPDEEPKSTNIYIDEPPLSGWYVLAYVTLVALLATFYRYVGGLW